MQRIIFATTNENKMKEIREILADFPVEILSLKEAGIQASFISSLVNSLPNNIPSGGDL